MHSLVSYDKPTFSINPLDYEHVISLGNKCVTATHLKNLGFYKESFPFDYIPTTPKLIRLYLEDNSNFFPNKNEILSKDGVWFGHFDLNKNYDITIETFRRRFERIYDVLRRKQKILFVYTDEAGIYNEHQIQSQDSYSHLKSIIHFIKNTFEYNDFTLVAFHTNKKFPIYDENMLNLSINVADELISDNFQTCEAAKVPYRETLKEFMVEFFKIPAGN